MSKKSKMAAFEEALDELTDTPLDLYEVAKRTGVGRRALGRWLLKPTGAKAMREIWAAREHRARQFLHDSYAQATRAIGGIAERCGEGREGVETQRKACVDAMKYQTTLPELPVVEKRGSKGSEKAQEAKGLESLQRMGEESDAEGDEK